MKKKIVTLILLLSLALSCLVLASCSTTEQKDTVTRMTVDINPSVELMVDEENKVISVTALNDDAAILIVGETFVGKSAEDAVELIVTLASDTGYLVKGSVEAEENTVNISVSGDMSHAKALYDKVSERADEAMRSLDIAGRVERVKALSLEQLRALALSTSLYTEEELSSMDEEKLCQVISLGRVETAELITEKMREAYFSAKSYEISFAQSEQIASIIEDMGVIYTVAHTTYKAALDAYKEAIDRLDSFRYDMLISPESEYQKALVALRDAKVELLKERSYTASLEVDGEEYASATLKLKASEENYDKALAAFERLGAELDASIQTLISALRQSQVALSQLESTLFDENIEGKLKENASEIEKTINEKKDGFFDAFENEHREDIAAYEKALAEKKQELISSIEGET